MSRAVELMALGMGTVLVFLTLLVVAMNAMAAALKGFADAPKAAPSRRLSAAPAATVVDPATQRVIALAIQKYRSEHGH